MPRATHVETRREAVAWVTAELVARHGVEAATMRAVADAAGSSTSIVTHYFTDKKDLLLRTFEVTAARARVRLEATRDADDELEAAIDALLPLDEERVVEWKVWFAFWGLAIGDAELSAVQRERSQSAREWLTLAIGRDRAKGRTPATLDPDLEARRLLALLHGIAAQSLFAPDEWPAERQRELVAGELARLRASTDRSPVR